MQEHIKDSNSRDAYTDSERDKTLQWAVGKVSSDPRFDICCAYSFLDSAGLIPRALRVLKR